MQAEELARTVSMLVCDVDGVLTDGGLYYDDAGRISKRFHVQDGLGIKLAQGAGLEVAVISGLESEAVRMRILELGISEYHAGRKSKLDILQGMGDRCDVRLEQMAYLGDDWVDASVMRRVGLPMAVANAQPEIKELAAWVSGEPGGDGAVREAIRFILKAQGKLDTLWRQWIE